MAMEKWALKTIQTRVPTAEAPEPLLPVVQLRPPSVWALDHSAVRRTRNIMDMSMLVPF